MAFREARTGRFTKVHRQGIAHEIERAGQRRAREIAEEIVAELQINPPTPRKTGALESGFRVVTDAEGNALIVNPVHYWRFQEFGTKTEKGAQWTPARHYVRTAIETVRARHTR